MHRMELDGGTLLAVVTPEGNCPKDEKIIFF